MNIRSLNNDVGEDWIKSLSWDLPTLWDEFYKMFEDINPLPDDDIIGFMKTPAATKMPDSLRVTVERFIRGNKRERDAMRPI